MQVPLLNNALIHQKLLSSDVRQVRNCSSGTRHLIANITLMLNQSRKKELFLSLCKHKYCHLFNVALGKKNGFFLSRLISRLCLNTENWSFLSGHCLPRLVDLKLTFHSRSKKLAVRQALLQGYCQQCQTVSYKTGAQTQQLGSCCECQNGSHSKLNASL